MNTRSMIAKYSLLCLLASAVPACSSPDPAADADVDHSSAAFSVIQRSTFPACQTSPSVFQPAPIVWGHPARPILWDGKAQLWESTDIALYELGINHDFPNDGEGQFDDVHDFLAIRRSTSAVVGRAFVSTRDVCRFEALHGVSLYAARIYSVYSSKAPTGNDGDKCTRDGCVIDMLIHPATFSACEVEAIAAHGTTPAPRMLSCISMERQASPHP